MDSLHVANALRLWFSEIHSPIRYIEGAKGDTHSDFFYLLRTLGASTRRCMDPADYVYGVLGIFQLKIPRMTDSGAVWQHFLTEFDKYMERMKNKEVGLEGTIIGISDRARKVNLLEAKDMSDVYNGFLEMLKVTPKSK